MNVFEEYRITSPYGWRNDPFTGERSFHTGVDLIKSHQYPIPAFVGGKVVHAREGKKGTGFGGFGKVVAVLDKYGHLHCYCHLDSIDVTEGTMIDTGEIIGRQGSTGRSTGSHLHFEVRAKSSPSYGWGTHVDPEKYLKVLAQKEITQDVSEWAKDAREWVMKEKISDGTRPHDKVTRKEVWVMLHRYDQQRRNDK